MFTLSKQSGIVRKCSRMFKIVVMNSIGNYRELLKERFRNEENLAQYGLSVMPIPTDFKRRALWLLNDSLKMADQQILYRFYGIRPGDDATVKIEGFANRLYRPLQFLFTRETSSEDETMLDFAALIIDFQPRPYRKFIQSGAAASDAKRTKEPVHNVVSERDSIEVWEEKESFEKDPDKQAGSFYSAIDKISEEGEDMSYNSAFFTKHPMQNPQIKNWLKWGLLVVVTLGIAGVIGFNSIFANNYSCMQWQTDHYERMSCDTDVADSKSVQKFDAHQFKVSRIRISDTTTFFKNEKPVVWYLKHDGKYDFFNSPGYHPELSDKQLNEISRNIAMQIVSGEIKPNF